MTNMSPSSDVIARAEVFLRGHFDLLNEGKRDLARPQLFFPSLAVWNKPVEVYLDAFARLAPVKVVSMKVTRVLDVREGKPPNARGPFASIGFDVQVAGALETPTVYFIVWWFPRADEFLVATRPAWILLAKQRP